MSASSSKEPGSRSSPLAPATKEEIHALWRLGILAWKLWEQQLQIYNVLRSLPIAVQIIVLLCARQFGKSVLSVLVALEDVLQNPGVIVVIIGPKVEQAAAIVRPRMKLLTRDAPKTIRVGRRNVPFIREVKSENTWHIWNESELKLGGYSSGAVSQRGKTLYEVFLEEFGPDTDADGYNDFLRSDVGPALMHSANARMIFPTTLPKIPDHPFITETIPEAQLNGAYFKFTIDDNKKLTPEKKAKAIKLAGGRESIDCKRELYCEIVRDPELVVVPSYVEELHVRDFELPAYYYMHITGDQGGTRDKTVWLLHTYDFLSDRDLIIDEVVADRNTPSSEVVRMARAKWGAGVGVTLATRDGAGFAVTLDAPPRQLVDLSDRETSNLSAALAEKDDWRANVNAMDVRFKERGRDTHPKIWIHPRCEFLRATCRSGTLNKTRTDFERTKTLGHMDALAALMYALRARTRTNPWPETAIPDGWFQKNAPVSETEAAARALQPKTFGAFAPKKFGKFKRD